MQHWPAWTKINISSTDYELTFLTYHPQIRGIDPIQRKGRTESRDFHMEYKNLRKKASSLAQFEKKLKQNVHRIEELASHPN